MTNKNYDPTADEQLWSIWEDTDQNHSTSNRNTSSSDVSSLVTSICITDKRNNNSSIEVSDASNKYNIFDAENARNNTPTPILTTIDTYDHTTISSMNMNTYNYIKKQLE